MSSNIHNDLVPILRNVFNQLMKIEKNGQASITKVIRYDTCISVSLLVSQLPQLSLISVAA